MAALLSASLLAGSGGPCRAAQAFPDDDAAEVGLWQAIQGSRNPADFQSFVQFYPRGRFTALAQLRLKRLQREAAHGDAPASAGPDAVPAPTDATPQVYFLDVKPGVATMGQTVTVRCRGLGHPALFDRIVVVPIGAPDFGADGKVDEKKVLWSGLPNLYDCAGQGIELPMMTKGSYEVRYLSRQYNPDGKLDIVVRSGFVYR